MRISIYLTITIFLAQCFFVTARKDSLTTMNMTFGIR